MHCNAGKHGHINDQHFLTCTSLFTTSPPVKSMLSPRTLAGADLTARWRTLVSQGAVSAKQLLANGVELEYGVRLSLDDEFQEYVLGDAELDAKLANGQGRSIVRCSPYSAQLQLIRSLRPPPTPNLADMPPYDAEHDSLVTGHLRLQLRPRVAQVSVAASRRLWDVYHNVSPCDPRGHFLVLPTIDSRPNWRRQSLTMEDCIDFVWLAMCSETSSDLLLCFNSVRAGASQNHIHLQAWPAPPIGLTEPYAVQTASVRTGVQPVAEAGFEMALLDYPVAALRFRILPRPEAARVEREAAVLAAGAALGRAVSRLQQLGLPHNLVHILHVLSTACMHACTACIHALGDAHVAHALLYLHAFSAWADPCSMCVAQVALSGDVWLFARDPMGETSPQFGASRLGASEMAGCFHLPTREHLEVAAREGQMAAALSSASAPPLEVWEQVKQAILGE